MSSVSVTFIMECVVYLPFRGLIMAVGACLPLSRHSELSRRRRFGIWAMGMIAGFLTSAFAVTMLYVLLPLLIDPSALPFGVLLWLWGVPRWVTVLVAWWTSRSLVRHVGRPRPIDVVPAPAPVAS